VRADQPLPEVEGGWRCVLADWPSRFRSNSEARPGRNAMRHYACMTPRACAELPVREIVADDCWLFLWMTGPFLAEGAHLTILAGWGFKPSALGFVWEKTGSFGTGFTTRQSCEFIVIGKRGKPALLSRSVRQFHSEKRREHSRKPDEFFSRIEAFCAGPRLELFARQRRRNWTCWGNEVDRFPERTLFDESPTG
jgi:N6-adenosine-specific RNA methylase IME4